MFRARDGRKPGRLIGSDRMVESTCRMVPFVYFVALRYVFGFLGLSCLVLGSHSAIHVVDSPDLSLIGLPGGKDPSSLMMT